MRGVQAEKMGGIHPVFSIHPVFHIHPTSGRWLLFVNLTQTNAFDGWTELEGRGLLNYLFLYQISLVSVPIHLADWGYHNLR